MPIISKRADLFFKTFQNCGCEDGRHEFPGTQNLQSEEITFIPKVNAIPESVPAAGPMRPSILPSYTPARILDSSSYGRPNDFMNPSSSSY